MPDSVWLTAIHEWVIIVAEIWVLFEKADLGLFTEIID